MATHSSVLAWRIPGTGEPGGLPSLGSHRVGHDWSNLAAAAVAVCGLFPGSSVSKETASVQDTQVQSLGQEDPLEKERANHSRKTPWREKPGGLQCMGLQTVRHDWVTKPPPACGLRPGLGLKRAYVTYYISHSLSYFICKSEGIIPTWQVQCDKKK